jgi:hypothetical protein
VAAWSKAQDAGQSLKNLNRGVTVTALLEPQVVVGADPGEHRGLFASQPRGAAHTARGQADAVGLDELAPRPQAVAEEVRLVHAYHGNRAGRGLPVPAAAGIIGALPVWHRLTECGVITGWSRGSAISAGRPWTYGNKERERS